MGTLRVIRRGTNCGRLAGERYQIEFAARFLLFQPAVHGLRALPALADRPYDERLPAPGVAACEDAVARGRPAHVGDVPARVELQIKTLDDPLRLRVQEAHREHDELGRDLELRALDLLERRWRADLVATQQLDLPVLAGELSGHHTEAALATFLVRARCAHDQGPARPRREVVGAVRRRFGQQLELRDRRRLLAVRVAEAVGAGVAAADDHDVLAGRADRLGRRVVAGHEAVALLEVLHREVDPVQVTAWDREVTRD